MEARVHIVISGGVQGVFFRDFVARNAHLLGLKGWVRNNSDGTVEVVAEGRKELLQELVSKCRSGPDLAQVESLDAEWGVAKGEFKDFRVRVSDRV